MYINFSICLKNLYTTHPIYLSIQHSEEERGKPLGKQVITRVLGTVYVVLKFLLLWHQRHDITLHAPRDTSCAHEACLMEWSIVVKYA